MGVFRTCKCISVVENIMHFQFTSVFDVSLNMERSSDFFFLYGVIWKLNFEIWKLHARGAEIVPAFLSEVKCLQQSASGLGSDGLVKYIR